jgi:hypothetical protein
MCRLRCRYTDVKDEAENTGVFATASVSKFINGSAHTIQLCMIACVALYDLHQSSNVLFVRLAQTFLDLRMFDSRLNLLVH